MKVLPVRVVNPRCPATLTRPGDARWGRGRRTGGIDRNGARFSALGDFARRPPRQGRYAPLRGASSPFAARSLTPSARALLPRASWGDVEILTLEFPLAFRRDYLVSHLW